MERKKPWIVLVPGMFSPGAVFYVLKILLETAGRRVIIVDFPHSKGPSGYCYSGPYQLDFWGKLEYLLAVLRKIEGEYELVGHSAGCPLVLKVSMYKDIEPKNIFLIAPAPIYGVMSLYPSVIWNFNFVLMKPNFIEKSIAMPSFKKFWKMMAHTLPEEQARSIFESLREESGRFIFQVGLWLLDTSDESTQIDFLKVNYPIRVIVGSEDRTTPVQIAYKIGKRAEITRLEAEIDIPLVVQVIKGCSHFIFHEIAGPVAEWIATPLDSIDSETIMRYNKGNK